jgi:hypothetical protein
MLASKLRTCTGCLCRYPASPKYFWRSNRERDGLRLRCKMCCRELPCMQRRISNGPRAAHP